MAPFATNLGKPRKTISEMALNSLQTQEEKANQYSTANADRAMSGKPLDKGSLASYQRKDSEKLLTTLPHCGASQKRFTGLPKIGISLTSSNPEAGGRMLKCHLKVQGSRVSGNT